MIIRHHAAEGVASEARYSDCERYRYLLTRRWGEGGIMLFVMLNPSTASELRNDPTVARCENRARRMGYGGFAVANIFGFRATLPADLRRAADPVGPENDAALSEAAAGAALILCGWGNHGLHGGRGAAVAARLRAAGYDLWHLGLTRPGAPRHPLFVPSARAPELWH